MKSFALCACVLAAAGPVFGGIAADFEDLTLDPNSYWNGSDGSGGFTSGIARFNNLYDPNYWSWEGWSYSNRTDTTTRGWGNQYSAIAGGGIAFAGGGNVVADPNGIYGVGYVGWVAVPTVTVTPRVIDGAYVTNTTYAYWSMKEGDAFAKKFGGADGNDADWFKLTVTGKDADGNATGTVDFYLADYRFADNGRDYILNEWTWMDLSGLGAVGSLAFTLSSSDVGGFGMNTPAYFAMDNVVPEPATVAVLAMAGLALRRRRKS